jgi:hypothetical protein
LTPDEMAFLVANVKPTDTVWEWGSGGTTAFLAPLCKRLTAVEHQPAFAASTIMEARVREHTNVSVLYVPPDLPYVEGTDDDGDLTTFRSYVEVYTGRNVDVVLVDGRARVEAFRHINERAQWGPDPEVALFLHDAQRPQYGAVFDWFREEARVERLSLLRAR